MLKTVAMLVGVITLAGERSAAAWELYAGTNGSDSVMIGCADMGNGHGYEAYLCVNGDSTPLDPVGGTCDLDNDVWFSALYGIDYVTLARTYVSFSCDGASRTWGPLNQDGFTVYVTGDQDGDIIRGKGGSEVQLLGNAGDDDIYVYSGSTDSWAYGGSGNDYLVGAGSVGGEELYGESGGDCLEDVGYDWDVMNCGVDTDTHDVNGQDEAFGTLSSCGLDVEECNLE